MIEEGEQAPRFELPGVRDGETEQVALEEYLGEDIVILAFYPGDFNPACSDDSTDLDELDLFTMQKDVSILGVSGDSVYSHYAFADEYDLHIPLLSDVHGEVASAYGVKTDGDERYPNSRAVAVINHKKELDYTWIADDVHDLPDTEEIRERIEGVGGDGTAQARYRVGHAHYIEGRRAFTSAMAAYEDMEWMMAQSDFTQANEEFGAARDEFNTANRFGEDEVTLKYYDRAERKAESLWRAAEWLSESANTFASGEGGEAERLRQDAEAPLENARDIHEPPDPDDFPPEEDPAEQEEEEVSILPDEEEETDTSLGVDLDGDDAVAMSAEDDSAQTADAGGDTAAVEPTQEETTAPDDATSTDEDEGEGSIDDDELEEIAAELEQQSEATGEETDEDIDDGNVVPDSVDIGDGVGTGNGTPATDGDETSSMFRGETEESGESDDRSTESDGPAGTTIGDGEQNPDEDEPDEDEHDAANIEGELEEDDIELDLTDPTEGESDDDDDEDDEDEELTDDDFGDGDHGVPDSL